MRSAMLCLLLVFMGPLPCWAEEPTNVQQFATTLEAVFECVLDHHVDPPTRQQMVLAVLRHLHQQDTPSAIAALSRTVSELGSKDALYQFMRSEIERFASKIPTDIGRASSWDLDWLSATIPGGIELTDAKRLEVEQQLAANRYVGIGVQLSKHNQNFVFNGVMDNGTAAKGGIMPGDVLLKVNGVAVDGDMQQVVEQLRGPEGSTLQVTVRTSGNEPRDVELRREVVVMKTLKLGPLRPDQTTAQILVNDIKASSVHELQTLVEQLPDSIDEVELTVQFDGSFHYFCLFADALFDKGSLGQVVSREGSRAITTSDGNVLAGRKLKIVLNDQDEQRRLLSCLALRAGNNPTALAGRQLGPMYLLESIKIMDGKATVSLATRRFEMGTAE